MNLILGLLSRFAQPLMIVGLIALSGLLLKAGWDNASLKRQVVKAEAKAEDERVKRVKAENDYADLIRDYNEQARAADERERRIEQDRIAAESKLRNDHAKDKASSAAAIELALNSLRNGADADRRRALKAEGDSPADCRHYAADPRNLSVPDAELLARIGGAAEQVVGKLAYCDGYIRRVVPVGDAGGR